MTKNKEMKSPHIFYTQQRPVYKKLARDFCRIVITIVPEVILQFKKSSLKIKANSAAEVLKTF